MPATASAALTRQALVDGHRVTQETSDGHELVYRFQRLADGGSRTDDDRRRLERSTVRTRAADGSTTIEYPDGSVERDEIEPDPRFGLQAPLIRRTLSTPAGLERVVQQSRFATLTDPARPALGRGPPEQRVRERPRGHHRVRRRDPHPHPHQSRRGAVSSSALDARGRVVSYTSASGLAPVEFTYDSEGRISRVDQGPQFWTYTFDSRDRILDSHERGGAHHRVRVRRRGQAHADRAAVRPGLRLQHTTRTAASRAS